MNLAYLYLCLMRLNIADIDTDFFKITLNKPCNILIEIYYFANIWRKTAIAEDNKNMQQWQKNIDFPANEKYDLLFALLVKSRLMKQEIHPKYQAVKVTCSCGNNFSTNSTLANNELHIEICSKCHPFYTGKQKLVDTAGRVDRFKQKYGKKAPPAQEQPASDQAS